MTSTLSASAPTYTLSSDGSIDEGGGLTFTASGTNVPDGTYYWTIQTGSGDFTTTSGSLGVDNNYGSFIVVPNADTTTEGSETFTVALRSGSVSGPILVTSDPVTINDTSFSLGTLLVNGTSVAWGSTNSTTPTYAAYTFPDTSTGSVHTLDGTQYVLTSTYGLALTLNFNLWFYPTSNLVNVMAELGQAVENSAWHYSMLEIDNDGRLKGRVWNMAVGVNSVSSVNLNAWNHVHFYYDHATTTFGISLNNETPVTSNVGGVRLTSDTGATFWGIGLYESAYMVTTARYQGKFDILSINDSITGSNYNATKAKYGF
jgi:hypothetical protein